MLPILAHGVLRDILVELNISHAQCDFEADNQIVAIANHLQCPVLSQDSDFYIYDIVSGFIRLDSIDLNCLQSVKPDGRTYYYLKCKIYYVSNFLSNFPGIDRVVLPLFGTLIGNDIVNIQTFETFFLNMKLPKMKSKKLKVSKRHIRMVGLLTWLQYRSLSEAVEFVLSCLKKSNRDAARELIYESVNAYKKCNTNLIHYLSDKIWEEGTPETESSLVTYEGYALPEWFIRHFHEGFLSPFFANASGLHRVFLQVQVEDANEPNTYLCSLSLRKVLYGIIFSVQSLLVGDHESPKQDKLTRLKYVEEHGRNGNHIQKSYIEPSFYIEGFGSVPTFVDLPKLDIKQKRQLLVSALGVNYDKLNSFPDSLQLLVGTVWFWIRNATPLISENFLNAFIVALIVLDVIKPYCSGSPNSKSSILLDKCVFLEDYPSLINIQKCKEDFGFKKLLFLKPEDVKTVEAKTRKYFRKPQHSSARKFVVSVVHSLNQFQTCLLFSLYLNKLLLEPFISPHAERFINGTFMYNLTRELQNVSTPELFVTELLGRNSSVLSVFQTLRYKIRESISSDLLVKVDAKPAGCQSVKKKKKGTNNPI
ncbi:protein asteroid homolog 1-like isoform X2 [Limulus polyphemus]|nr:protein asteroid homolog 1-like isoform X2 [Limulus polyphemus]